MYAGMCYSACLEGVYAMLDSEDNLRKLLSLHIKCDKHIIDIILNKYNIHSEYSILHKLK